VARTFDDFIKDWAPASRYADESVPLPTNLQTQAHLLYTLEVIDLIERILINVLMTAHKVQNAKAVAFLQNGVGRRLKMLEGSTKTVLRVAAPNRKKPLIVRESLDLTRDLNLIYLNIRGSLDSACWALLHEFSPTSTTANPSRVGLFSKTIRDNPTFAGLHPILDKTSAWNSELKKRRDPAAHRIPLYVPPQTFNDDERAKYIDLCKMRDRAFAEKNFEQAEALINEIDRLGTFFPYFVHDADDPAYFVYPTVPDDIAHTLIVLDGVNVFINSLRN
jgi:hypothetical protein